MDAIDHVLSYFIWLEYAEPHKAEKVAYFASFAFGCLCMLSAAKIIQVILF